MIEQIELSPLLARSIRYALCDVGYTCYEITGLQSEDGCYKVFFVGEEIHNNSAYFTGSLSETEVTDFSLAIFDKEGKLCQ